MTIAEILRLPPQKRKELYKVDGIEYIKIDGTVFTGYKAFTFLLEKSYVLSPERSSGGVIDNLNSHATFITPHLKIDFSIMSIDDYRTLMGLLYSKNEFLVECYDIVNNTITRNKMYFATEEMPKLWTIVEAINGDSSVELLGVQDYVVEMIGSNASLETVDILYYDNNGTLIAEATQTVDKNTEAIINYDFVPNAPYRFDGVWIDETGAEVKNGEAITVIKEKKLTAKVVDTNQYTLSFNYGKGVAPVETTTSQPVLNVPITKGQTIATAINNAKIQTTNGVFQFPTKGTGLAEVNYTLGDQNKKISGDLVYYFVGWYWTSEKNTATMVLSSTTYDYNFNRTIFQIYEPIKHRVLYQTNTEDISLDNQSLGYGETIPYARLARKGYSFGGWFLDSAFTKTAPTTMPPEEITVYAKWEEVK